MIAYAIPRILLMIPTLLAIMVVNFVIIQAALGGPIQQMISKFKGTDVSATERVSGTGGELRNAPGGNDSQYRGARGLDPSPILK
jgi:microcin C transport system permease protein